MDLKMPLKPPEFHVENLGVKYFLFKEGENLHNFFWQILL